MSLDAQEGVVKGRDTGPYLVEVVPATVYGDDGATVPSEVYVSRRPLALDHPEGRCSERYRRILERGARECGLEPSWIRKLEELAVYEPSEETLL